MTQFTVNFSSCVFHPAISDTLGARNPYGMNFSRKSLSYANVFADLEHES